MTPSCSAPPSATTSLPDFDANGADTLVNQDLIDISLYAPDITGGIAGDFAARVSISANGVGTVITIDGTQQITLLGVTGIGNNVITQQDFIL